MNVCQADICLRTFPQHDNSVISVIGPNPSIIELTDRPSLNNKDEPTIDPKVMQVVMDALRNASLLPDRLDHKCPDLAPPGIGQRSLEADDRDAQHLVLHHKSSSCQELL